MTRDEILNMPAGREMNGLIFEYVFGAKWYHNKDRRNFLIMPEDAYTETGEFSEGKIETEKTPYIGGRPYSKDIVEAWKVIEKLKSAWVVEVGCNDRIYWCEMYNHAGVNGWVDAKSKESAAHAVCRAALLAVMEAE